jgi:hypothetical protein
MKARYNTPVRAQKTLAKGGRKTPTAFRPKTAGKL